MRQIIFSALILCLGIGLAHAEDVKELRIGVEPGYPPFEFKTSTGQITGFDVEVGEAICAKLHRRCKWVSQPFDSLMAGLLARKFDLIHSGLTVTARRKKAVDFTVPIYGTSSQLVARKDSGLDSTAAALKGKRVGALQGSEQARYAIEHWRQHGAKIITYQDQAQTFADLSAGRLDAALFEKPNASVGFLARPEGEDFTFVGKPFTNDPELNSEIAMAMRKHSDQLKKQVDQAISELQDDGTIAKLAKKYFKQGGISLLHTQSAKGN